MHDPERPAASYLELIEPTDPPRPLLLLCDHAGNEVPAALAGLGLGPEALARHIGWDIGAADLTRALARHLGAAAILNHCSRLVIDPNRHPGNPTSIPPVSDDCVVPGNQDLTAPDRAQRVRDWFLPYHRAVAHRLAAFRRAGQVPAVIAVHSFTPRLNGQDRPWQVGVLWRHDRRLSDPLLAALRARGDLVVGDNQPYSGLGEFGFTVEFHCQRTQLPHVMVEVRQNEIDSTATAERHAAILATALAAPLSSPDLFARFAGDPDAPGLEGFSWRRGSRL